MNGKIHITIASLFPQLFPGPLGASLLGKALEKNLWSLEILDLRHYGKNNRVDDKLYGGLPGMLIKPTVIENLIESNNNKWTRVFYTSPKGKVIDQKYLKETFNSIVENSYILIICGRYEGIDERAIVYYNMEEFSLGNFILTGGELCAMAFIEGLIRLIPGVIGNKNSLKKESFSTEGYIQSSRYTRPRLWKNKKVPELLLSGHHKNIENY